MCHLNFVVSKKSQSRMRVLRIECKDKLFNWFDLDEEKEVINAPEVVKILKENVAHYFSIPVDKQIIFDEQGVIGTACDFRRSVERDAMDRVLLYY